VAALGEGLETQFWRVDNGQVRWLTVGLPGTIALRHRLLPDGPRRSSHSGSALDLKWLDGLDRADPILVTAQGLLPYFQRVQVHGLIAGIAGGLPGSPLVFDAVPEVMLDLVRRASGRKRDLALELWTWLFNPAERAAISGIPSVEELRDLAPPLTRNPCVAGDRRHQPTPKAAALLAACVACSASPAPHRLRGLNSGTLSAPRAWNPRLALSPTTKRHLVPECAGVGAGPRWHSAQAVTGRSEKSSPLVSTNRADESRTIVTSPATQRSSHGDTCT
jgi:hypothetical protein